MTTAARIALFAVLLLVAGAFVLAFVFRGQSAPGTVTFRDRQYIYPSNATRSQIARRWDRLVDMHAKDSGMEVFIPASVLHRGFSPTILLLRRNDSTFMEYELSGGP